MKQESQFFAPLLRWFGYLGIGFLAGLAIIIFLFLGLGLIGEAFGGEATPVREATLSESGVSYNYDASAAASASAIADGMLADAEASVYIPDYAAIEAAERCDDHNKRAVVMIEFIADLIIAHPKLGYFYADTLISIRDDWCTE